MYYILQNIALSALVALSAVVSAETIVRLPPCLFQGSL
jgi:hypothetical protein